jgi:dihydroflavonol-4-reductase
MKALVTGGTGFIGSHLVRRLRNNGSDVRCIVRDLSKAQELVELGVEIVDGDLCNGIAWESVLDGVTEIFHLAGVTRAKANHQYYDGNQKATHELVGACKKYCTDLRRFVHISSLAAVGPSRNGLPLCETESFHPVSHYGRSKMLSELEVHQLRGEIPFTILRPSIVYGPQERDMFEYFRMVRKGIYPLVGSNPQWVNLVHADDLVEAMLRSSADVHAVNETYFIGSERQFTVEEVGNTIADAVGRQPIRIHVPENLVIAAGVVVGVVGKITGQAVFFNLQKAKEATQTAWVCSVHKAREHFGYRQSISLESGFQETYEWYVKHGWFA